MYKNIKFSIIIIIRNDIDLIATCLKSINEIEYDRNNFEVIVVDDGSEQPIAERLTIKPNYNLHIEYVPRDANSSRSRARNVGVSLASNEQYIFIDGDHAFEKCFLNQYAEAIGNLTEESVVLGSRREFYGDRARRVALDVAKQHKLEYAHKRLFANDLRLVLLEKLGVNNVQQLRGVWHLVWSCNFCISANIFNKIGGFDEEFKGWGFEDVELGYRLVKFGCNIELINNYIWHLPSMEPKQENRYMEWLTNLEYFYLKYKDKNILLQFEFDNVFFYSNNLENEFPGAKADWLACYENFENKLRYIAKQAN